MLKSLEIVNEIIKNIEDTLKEIKSGPFYDIRVLDLNKFKTIQQDLEVFHLILKLLKINEVSHFIDGKIHNKEYLEITNYSYQELMKIKNYIITNKVGDDHDYSS